MATIKRMGFGQVEPNHLSAQRTAQIYAQLPANKDIAILENGQFVKYDYAKGEVNFDGAGEWMMVFNEVKLYDDFWKESYKDYAMQAKNFTPGDDEITHNGVGPLKGQMVPRVIKTNPGDHYTTNCVGEGNTAGNVELAGIELEVGDIVGPTKDSKGYLVKDGNEGIQFQVVKVYTMADGQPAVKLMRI
jgi:hypothetical protein